MNFMFLHLVDDRYDNLWHEVEVVLPSTKGALLAWSCHLQTWWAWRKKVSSRFLAVSDVDLRMEPPGAFFAGKLRGYLYFQTISYIYIYIIYIIYIYISYIYIIYISYISYIYIYVIYKYISYLKTHVDLATSLWLRPGDPWPSIAARRWKIRSRKSCNTKLGAGHGVGHAPWWFMRE